MHDECAQHGSNDSRRDFNFAILPDSYFDSRYGAPAALSHPIPEKHNSTRRRHSGASWIASRTQTRWEFARVLVQSIDIEIIDFQVNEKMKNFALFSPFLFTISQTFFILLFPQHEEIFCLIHMSFFFNFLIVGVVWKWRFRVIEIFEKDFEI